MKLKIGHHISTKDLTSEQYHTFCKKAIDQGFYKGEYEEWDYSDWGYVGIRIDGEIFHEDTYFSVFYPDMLLTIEQALEDENTKDVDKLTKMLEDRCPYIQTCEDLLKDCLREFNRLDICDNLQEEIRDVLDL